MTDPKSFRTPNPNELLGTRAACGKVITFAWIVTAITAFFALIASLRVLPDDRYGVIRYWFLIQTLFLIVVTFFMRRKSRVAFVLALVYELVTLILMIFVLGNLRGLPGSIFGVVTYFAGMLAAFRWHELDPEETVAPPSDTSPGPSPGSTSEPVP
ncbi:hypothetical protein KKD52_10865 [Myxococcota bacterium]|nr:hypothetical protein [Myxococcota bacterium]MBU1410070.1 hypothetical protein [Myxococcota bacterium]MBU1510852.1 hypothetical protein [Myxococcota bacterium]